MRRSTPSNAIHIKRTRDLILATHRHPPHAHHTHHTHHTPHTHTHAIHLASMRPPPPAPSRAVSPPPSECDGTEARQPRTIGQRLQVRACAAPSAVLGAGCQSRHLAAIPIALLAPARRGPRCRPSYVLHLTAATAAGGPGAGLRQSGGGRPPSRSPTAAAAAASRHPS